MLCFLMALLSLAATGVRAAMQAAGEGKEVHTAKEFAAALELPVHQYDNRLALQFALGQESPVPFDTYLSMRAGSIDWCQLVFSLVPGAGYNITHVLCFHRALLHPQQAIALGYALEFFRGLLCHQVAELKKLPQGYVDLPGDRYKKGLEGRIIKDIFLRYHAQRGFYPETQSIIGLYPTAPASHLIHELMKQALLLWPKIAIMILARGDPGSLLAHLGDPGEDVFRAGVLPLLCAMLEAPFRE